jgi:hypothetical protein
VEYVFSSQKTQATDEFRTNVKAEFDEFSQKNFQKSEQFEKKVMSTLESRFGPIEADVKAMGQTMSQALEMQQAGVAQLGGSLTELTEGCAHQVIQESKAAAYTLQAKMTVLEEEQKRSSFEAEERLASKMHQFEKVVSEKIKSQASTMQTFPDNLTNFFVPDPDAASRTLEALRSMEMNLSEAIKGMNKDQSRQLELGLGVFGSALRTQLDSMQQATTGLTKETEAKLDSKLDRLQEQGKKHTDKIISQLTLQQAASLQGPISSSFHKPSNAHSSGSSRRHSANMWSES